MAEVLDVDMGETDDVATFFTYDLKSVYRDFFNSDPRSVTYDEGIARNPRLFTGCKVSTGRESGGGDRRAGGDASREVRYSPVGALGALVLFVAGLIASDRALRRNGPPWLLYCGWFVSVLGGARALYVFLWWVWAS